MTPTRQSRCCLILGMHRSGTSALSGALSIAGVYPGPNHALMPASASINAKGFWEHQEIVDVHDRLLAALGSSWDDERPLPAAWWQRSDLAGFRDELWTILSRDFSGSPLWLLKDPRLCRLLPLWFELLHDLGAAPCFILCLRHPAEVARSLMRRDAIQDERASMLWLQHLIDSERATRGWPRVVVTYDQLLSDWREVFGRIGSRLPIELKLNEAAIGKIDMFLEPDLHHHRIKQDETSTNGSLQELAAEVYAGATRVEIDTLVPHLEAVQREIDTKIHCVAGWSAEIQALRKANAILQTRIFELDVLKAEIARIKATASWRITKPLRLLANLPRLLRGSSKTTGK